MVNNSLQQNITIIYRNFDDDYKLYNYNLSSGSKNPESKESGASSSF
jgi:hypothetical protein